MLPSWPRHLLLDNTVRYYATLARETVTKWNNPQLYCLQNVIQSLSVLTKLFGLVTIDAKMGSGHKLFYVKNVRHLVAYLNVIEWGPNFSNVALS
jgi:hypothetical protein